MRREIHKFGGTSVARADRLVACARLVAAAAQQASVVVVSSAMGGVTDVLAEAASLGAAGDATGVQDRMVALRQRHFEAFRELDGEEGSALHVELGGLLDDLEAQLTGLVALRELSARVRDRILSYGEKLSVRLFARALRREGVEARARDADTFLETDANFGNATPLFGVADRAMAAALGPDLEARCVPVVTGFCGQAPDGATSTLGRGGSDYSATLLGAALDADHVIIWTDVNGVFSADPRIVPEARPVPQLNFREAAELSYYGAKVLHQRTIIPVAARSIPVSIRFTMEPELAGTRVDERFTAGSHPVKAVGAVRNQGLIAVEGKGMAGVPGIAARVFGALAREDISVTMISQSSSESSICFAVPSEETTAAEVALKREFRVDLTHGDVEEIAVRPDVGLVAAVGLGMAHAPGMAARVCSALAERRINILAIAQGSSEVNISVAVADADVQDAVRAIHREFDLHRLDTGEDTSGRLDVVLFGFGNIGRDLARLLGARREHFRERFGLELRVVAVADRSGYVLDPRGIGDARLEAVRAAKDAGGRLADLEGASAGDLQELLREAARFRLARPVLVDATNASGALRGFLEAFGLGFDVVTANKLPLAGPHDAWVRLQEAARASGRVLKAEATVGAGLPVVDTIEMLLATGDVLLRAEGCLSGTLAFLLGRVEEGMALSAAVREAIDRAYTEPDPFDDLSGWDVARKALILGRISGLVVGDVSWEPEGLVDAALAGLPRQELLKALEAYDAPLRDRVARCREEGLALRYVASVAPGSVRVGLREVPAGSALGMLAGTDNMLVFHTERYRTRPLVVTGPGAGVEVTAMGVLGDVLRIAAERRGR